MAAQDWHTVEHYIGTAVHPEGNPARRAAIDALDRLEADLGALRKELEWLDRCGGLGEVKHTRIQAALATDAGRALLERVRHAEACINAGQGRFTAMLDRAEKAEAERDQVATLAQTIGEQAKALLAERDALRAELTEARATVERMLKAQSEAEGRA